MNVIPPYPPGVTLDEARTPPPAPTPDPVPAWIPEWWPEWAPALPTTPPEISAWGAAILGLVALVMVLVSVVRRARSSALPGGQVTPPKGGKPKGGDDVDVYERRLLRGILVLAPALLALTFYGSFHAVEKLAQDHKVDPSWIPPIAIDGILLLFLFVDLYFAKKGTPNSFVKTTTRGFIAFTLVANGVSGLPDPVAVLLHIPAPLGIVVITEVARQALVRQAKKNAGDEDFDEIPFTRWILDPVGTASMRRWMILRNVRSYPTALMMNEARRDALAMLAALTPSQRAQVPGYLRRRLRVGADVPNTVRAVRSLVATVTSGGHVPAFVSRVDASSTSSTPDPAVPAPRVDGVDAPAVPSSTPTGPAELVHVESTWTSTPTPPARVDGVDRRVDERVDEDVADPGHTPTANGFAPSPSTSADADEAARVDEVDVPSTPTHPTNGVHLDGVWRTPGTHTAAPAPDDEDDEGTDPDDDGPRGGGSSVPTPANGIPVLAGQHPGDGFGADERTASVLDEVRTAVDAPTWDDAVSKKDRVLSLLWETRGDATRAATLYQDRTGEQVPRDLYRSNPRGYAWAWHTTVTDHLVSHYGDTDRVRSTLAAAGVDTTHEAVLAALHAWADNHQHVIPINRLTTTRS